MLLLTMILNHMVTIPRVPMMSCLADVSMRFLELGLQLCMSSPCGGLGAVAFLEDSRFSKFYRSQCSKAASHVVADSTAPEWPMPMPYHGKQLTKNCTKDEAALRAIVNLQISMLNFLRLGEPDQAPVRIRGNQMLTSKQWGIVARLRKLCGAWYNSGPIDAAMLGRTAAKQEQQEDVLQRLRSFAYDKASGLAKYRKLRKAAECTGSNKHTGYVIGKVSNTNLCGAKSILASRIKMEGLVLILILFLMKLHGICTTTPCQLWATLMNFEVKLQLSGCMQLWMRNYVC